MEKINKNIGLGSVIISLLFLFNPNMNLVDILPDVIGYILLCRGLTYLSDLNEYCSRALVLFRRMIFVDAAKVLVMIWVFGISFSDEQNTLLLLGSFVFAILELFFLIPAYNNLFDGLMHLGFKYENNSVMKRRSERSRRNLSEKTKSFTMFFVLVKTAMYLLPELSVLGAHSYDESSSSSTVSMYSFIGLIRLMCCLVALVFGLIWLSKTVKYFKTVKADRAFVDSLKMEYTKEILPKKSLFLQRDIKGIFFVLVLFAVLCADMRADGFNFLPDILPAAALLIAGVLSKKHIADSKKYLVPFGIYAASTVLSMAAEMIFFDKYYYSAVIRDEGAFRMYCVMLVLAALEALAFLWSSYGIIHILKSVIDSHTGFAVRGSDGAVAAGAKERIEALHKELYKKLWLVGSCAVLLAASDVLYDFGARKLGFVGALNVVFSLIFAFAVYSAVSNIFEEVQSKYMLD